MFSDIEKRTEKAMEVVQSYCGTTKKLDRLGYGISGIVFLTPSLTAVKIHHGPEGFAAEYNSYRLLRQNRITQIDGITVPKLRRTDLARRLIEIDFVSPPFLLDFAGVKFTDPGFSSETQADVYPQIDNAFGRNAHIVYSVRYQLLKMGMYYLDFRPSNLNLTGLPGLDTTPEDPEDDLGNSW